MCTLNGITESLGLKFIAYEVFSKFIALLHFYKINGAHMLDSRWFDVGYESRIKTNKERRRKTVISKYFNQLQTNKRTKIIKKRKLYLNCFGLAAWPHLNTR